MNKVLQESRHGVIFRFYEPKLRKDASISSICATFSSHIPPNMLEWMANSVPSMYYKPLIYLSCFGTYEDFRRRGYGRQMIQWVKDYFKHCVIWLEVGSTCEMTNEQLIGFYESEGFKCMPGYSEHSTHTVMYIDL